MSEFFTRDKKREREKTTKKRLPRKRPTKLDGRGLFRRQRLTEFLPTDVAVKRYLRYSVGSTT